MIRALLSVMLCFIALFVEHPLIGAPVPRANFTFRLAISLDRKTYLPFEPIFVEWAIVNGREEAIEYAAIVSSTTLCFDYATANGEKGKIYHANGYDYEKPPPFFPLARRGTVRRWVDLREFYGLQGTGEFKITAECKVAYKFAGSPEPLIVSLRSREVTFRIAEAAGADLDAMRLIEKSFPEDPIPLGTPRKEALQEAMRQYNRRSQWTLDGRVTDRVLTKTKSPRYRANAHFYEGYLLVLESTSRNDKTIRRRELQEVSRHLQECLSSKDSSAYLKGLASYYLLLGKSEEAGTESRKEVEKGAKKLMEDYPNTFMADEARKLLSKRPPPKK
jgi:hypothetical protein